MHNRPFSKRGIHGIGILLIFISVLIIAVAASGLVISNANKLEEEGLQTYDQINDNMKNFQIVEVSGYDGRDQNITLITIDAKISGGSSPIDMRKMSLSLGEEDERTILKFRGDGAPNENSNRGYNTWEEQEFGALAYTAGTEGYLIDADLDDDGLDDYLGLNATHVTINISGNDQPLSYALGADLSSGPVTLDLDTAVTAEGEHYGSLVMSGTTTQADAIDAALTVTFTPYHKGAGYYTAEHLIRAAKSRNGYLVQGDVVRFYVEPYNVIEADEVVDIRVMYQDLEAMAKKIYAGNTFPSTNKVALWPKP